MTSDSSRVIADFIFQVLLCRWGALAEIVIDNAPAYIAALDILAAQYGIHNIKISSYNSRANGIVESKHFNVREVIMKTCLGNESKWREVLPQVFWAERVTIRKATGYSPYYMAHGVHPVLPLDILEVTYLAPPQDFGMSTEDLVALCARQLSKQPEDLESMQEVVSATRRKNLECFKRMHASKIIDFDFKPGDLVLVRNSCVEESLNRKTKPCYVGPMVVVHKTKGTSYIMAELNGAQSELHVTGFRVIPYFARSKSLIPVVSDFPDDKDFTEDNPKDTLLLRSDENLLHRYITCSPPTI